MPEPQPQPQPQPRPGPRPGPQPRTGPPAPGRLAPPAARVTVAVITRDRRDGLLRTLGELAALPERPPVIVVDNASGDGTAEAVAARFPEVRLVRPGRNMGAVGRNLAVALARTPYVAFSDDDSWWAPGALEAAAGLLDAHPRLGLVAARTLVGPERDEDPLNRVLAASPLPGGDAGVPGTPVLGFLACASVVRRTAFLAAGGFHPVLFFGAEETLLAYDLAARGWEVRHVPGVVAHHHPGDAGPRTGRPARLLRNALLTTWLRRPLRVAAAATARLAAEACRDPAAREALRGTAARLPGALRARRPLPPHVEDAARLLHPLGDREGAR
jgi:GT2 family glycosyltransferase